MQVREAVQIAKKYLGEVFDTTLGHELLLEGVEKTDDGRFWKVTFSYLPTLHNEDAPFEEIKLKREYKTIKVRDSDGEFFGAQNGLLLGAF